MKFIRTEILCFSPKQNRNLLIVFRLEQFTHNGTWYYGKIMTRDYLSITFWLLNKWKWNVGQKSSLHSVCSCKINELFIILFFIFLCNFACTVPVLDIVFKCKTLCASPWPVPVCPKLSDRVSLLVMTLTDKTGHVTLKLSMCLIN